MQLFFSLLALVALGGAVLLVIARLTGGRLRLLEELRRTVAPYAVPLAWIVALTSMLGSLYFSEIADLVPCRLCWYQRIAMYPLAVILLVATVRKDRGVRFYALPLAVIGAAISTYHYVIEWFPELETDGVCSVDVPCTFVWFRRLGFVTIPFMALCGFLAVIALLITRPNEERTPT
jgi:disulfide bond formation protein DsbB